MLYISSSMIRNILFQISKKLFVCLSSCSLMKNCQLLLQHCEVSTVMMNLLKGTYPISSVWSQWKLFVGPWGCMNLHVTSFSSTLIKSTNTNHQMPSKIQVAQSFGFNVRPILLAVGRAEKEWSLIVCTCSSLSCFPLINVVDDGPKWWQLLAPKTVLPSEYLHPKPL